MAETGHTEAMTIIRVPTPTPQPLNRADLVGQMEPLDGRRATLANETGTYPGYRVTGGLRLADGFPWVVVVPERAWWAHELLGTPLDGRQWPAGAVWVE